MDQEPLQKPYNENTTPPFLTQEQLQEVGDSFSYDNFNIVNPPKGQPYLVITVPDKAQNLVNHAFDKANGNYYLAACFHPELTTTKFHEYFLKKCLSPNLA